MPYGFTRRATVTLEFAFTTTPPKPTATQKNTWRMAYAISLSVLLVIGVLLLV